MCTEVMLLWTSLTLTSATPSSWDIWRTASLRARRWTAWSAVATSAWVIRACGWGGRIAAGVVEAGPRLHVGEGLAHLADADDDARSLLPFDHQRLDELGADVEHGVVAVELPAAAQDRELLAPDHRASSSSVDLDRKSTR